MIHLEYYDKCGGVNGYPIKQLRYDNLWHFINSLVNEKYELLKPLIVLVTASNSFEVFSLHFYRKCCIEKETLHRT